MNINQALDYLNHTMGMNQPRGLERMKRLLDALGNPEKTLKFVHVAGTNGKGSTVAFLSSIFRKAGYKTGVYTSPGLMRYNERIVVNGSEIGNEEIIEYVERIKEIIENEFTLGEPLPSFFEMTLAVAFLFYVKCDVDIVLLEVGLGGRFDATNVIDVPEVAIITTIDMDHMDRLGNTIEQIAFEKAGIIKENGRVVLYPQVQEARHVLVNKAEAMHAHCIKVNSEDIEDDGFSEMYQLFSYKDHRGMASSLMGVHQLKNVATVIEAVEVLRLRGFKISEEALREGIKTTQWAGRFEKLSIHPILIVDAAHNREGVKALLENMNHYYPNKKIRFIYGVMADKDYLELIDMVMPIASHFYCVRAYSDRAVDELTLQKSILKKGGEASACVSPQEAIEEAMKACGEDEIICAFGSFYYIGHVRSYFGKK